MVCQALADNAATVLLGPRQVGKSTLARTIAAVRPDSVYLDLELDQDLRKLDDAAAYPLRDGAEVMPLLQAIEEVMPGDAA